MEYNLIKISESRYNFDNLQSKFFIQYILDEKKGDYTNITDYFCYTGINLSLISIKLQSNTFNSMFNEMSKVKYYNHLNDKQKKVIYEIIFINQKIKFLLYKFFFKIKLRIKCRKNSFNKNTLLLKNFEEIDQNNILKLYYNGGYFTFDAKELAININNSLLINEYMFPTPKIPKNPYNNDIFNISTLSSIYNHLIINRIKVPLCFEMYKKCNFNINTFTKKFSYFLNENAIKDHIFNLNNDILIDTVADDIIQIAEEDGWLHKLPPSFPRFDTFCRKCFKNFILTNDSNISILKKILFNQTCNSNLKNYNSKIKSSVDIFGITSQSSEYFIFWNTNHIKHMFIPKKKKKDINSEIPVGNEPSIYSTLAPWVMMGEENFNQTENIFDEVNEIDNILQ